MFPMPENIHDLRRFLGLTGFFRKFVRNFAEISRPLRPLLQTTRNSEFIWRPEHTHAFEMLKSCLIGEPTLALYDRTKSHEVHTDASAIGLAGVIMQERDGSWKQVSYCSRHNNEAEQKYHSTTGTCHRRNVTAFPDLFAWQKNSCHKGLCRC